MKKPEILSPGGDTDSVKAAIAAGADAVYAGLKKFNARKRAENIEETDLSYLLNIAHSNNVKFFVTMNILLTQSELKEAVFLALKLYNLGVDALIVQDAGLAFLLQKYVPELEIHASTQMTTHNSRQIDFLHQLNFKQVNFSRELSLLELKKICSSAHDKFINTEVFVHGAYCVSCSGICYFSSFSTGEPANRGACVQLCRRKYSLKPGGEKFYLLNLKDNSAIEHAESLMECNTDVFKIEGRIKNFFYVYETTSAWRKKIDDIFKIQKYDNKKIAESLKKVFNRNFSAGYLEGEISSSMFNSSPFDQSLEFIGKVNVYNADRKVLSMKCSKLISAGSKISIFTEDRNFVCTAEIKKNLHSDEFAIEIENVLMGKIMKGQDVFLTGHAEKINEVKSLIASLKHIKKEIKILVSGKEGELLTAKFLSTENSAEVKSSIALSKAEKNSLDAETLFAQFGRLGDTDYSLADVDVSKLESNLFLPIKELNAMRRNAMTHFVKPVKIIEYNESENGKKIFKKKIAALFSSKHDYLELSNNPPDLCFLEMTAASRKDDFSENLHPWIPAFITDTEFQCYIDLLSVLKPELVVTDNTGFATWCSENKIDWIAGLHLNSSNGSTFDAYAKCGARGGFYSSEISFTQADEFKVAADLDFFYKVFGPVEMMSSRQCFFQNAFLCPQQKKIKDGYCLNNCANSAEFFDEHGKKFYFEKRKGYINRIFHSEMLFLPDAVNNVQSDYYLVDFRNINNSEFNAELSRNVMQYFQDSVLNEEINKKLLNVITDKCGKTIKGGFSRGFDVS